MALYLGNNKVNINLDGIIYCLNLYSDAVIVNVIRLLSSDNYVLKDSNGLYLIPKIDDSFNTVASSGGHVLKDSNGMYSILKES